MTEEKLELFYQLLIKSIDAVQQEYLYTVYGEMDVVLGMIQDLTRRKNLGIYMRGSELHRTGERIFCYELYHQLRMRMDQSADHFKSVYLQGELRKYQIPELLERMGLARLSTDFIPDFLVHSPGNANDHACVIEVKTDLKLSYRAIAADIGKIVEFMERYNYQRGIFICTRISFDAMCELVNTCKLLEKIPAITRHASAIKLLNREHEQTPTRAIGLNELLPAGLANKQV